MADIKISELGTASAVNNTDLFPMTSSGVTVKATAQQIKNYMGVGNITDLNTDEKSSAVAAINEVDAHADNAQSTADNAQQIIAPILSSLVAPTGGLESGDQFIYNGLLYKATATIAQGGTITINGNCTLADSVTKQIKAVIDDLTNITQIIGHYILWQSNNQNCDLYVYANGMAELNIWNMPVVNLNNMSALTPPKRRIDGSVINRNNAPVGYRIEANGKISFAESSANIIATIYYIY